MNILEITIRSLVISSSATIAAASWSLPLAYILSGRRGRLGRMLVNVTNALVGVPTVVIGLLLYMLFSRKGPIGWAHILYTPLAIMIGEAILVTPLLISLYHQVLSRGRHLYWETVWALGATPIQAASTVFKETLPLILDATLLGFARAIGELGVALTVGGNIKGYTRVLTTSIALEISKGEFEVSLKLGAILLIVVLLVNMAMSFLRGKGE